MERTAEGISAIKPVKKVAPNMRIRAMVTLLVACVTATMAGAYGVSELRSAPGTFSVSLPFSIDAPGKHVTIPFDVREGEVDTTRRLMVALDVAHGPDLPGVEDLRANARSLRVAVFYLANGKMVPLETEDLETIVARNTDKPLPHADTSVCHLELYASLDDESHIIVCGFYVKHPGHYEADVSTIEPLPKFRNVLTTLKIDQFFNTGE